jgi:hypothetical protein
MRRTSYYTSSALSKGGCGIARCRTAGAEMVTPEIGRIYGLKSLIGYTHVLSQRSSLGNYLVKFLSRLICVIVKKTKPKIQRNFWTSCTLVWTHITSLIHKDLQIVSCDCSTRPQRRVILEKSVVVQ